MDGYDAAGGGAGGGTGAGEEEEDVGWSGGGAGGADGGGGCAVELRVGGWLGFGFPFMGEIFALGVGKGVGRLLGYWDGWLAWSMYLLVLSLLMGGLLV